MFIDTEDYDGNEYENEFVTENIRKIAIGVFSDDIIDDNPSPQTGQTGLDQVTMYVFGVTSKEALNETKLRILGVVYGLKGGCSVCLNGLNEYFEPKRIEVKEKMYEERELSLIAKNIKSGLITNDNPSISKGYTALDQVLTYMFNIKSKERLREYKLRIKSKLLDITWF